MDAGERRRTEESDIEAVAGALEGAPISLAVLFGSHARDEARATSDVDLAVAFDDSLSSVERTRARLALIERLSRALETDAVDVIPLERAPDALVEEIRRDGVFLRGSRDELDARYLPDRMTARREEPEGFDDLLADLDGIV